MRTGLIALLTGTSAISTIVSSRVYVSKAPQKATFPYIVITQNGSEEFETLDATSGLLRSIDFAIDCKAKTNSDSATLGDAVLTAIRNYTGTTGGYAVKAVLVNGEDVGVESPTDGSDAATHVVSVDTTFFYQTA